MRWLNSALKRVLMEGLHEECPDHLLRVCPVLLLGSPSWAHLSLKWLHCPISGIWYMRSRCKSVALQNCFCAWQCRRDPNMQSLLSRQSSSLGLRVWGQRTLLTRKNLVPSKPAVKDSLVKCSLPILVLFL